MSWLGSLNQPVTIPCWFSILPAVFAFCWLSERIRRHQMSSGNRGRWDQWLLDLLGLCGTSLFVTTWSLSFMGCALSQGVFSFPLIAVTFTLREMGCFSWEINIYLTHLYMCCILDPKSFFHTRDSCAVISHRSSPTSSFGHKLRIDFYLKKGELLVLCVNCHTGVRDNWEQSVITWRV